MTRLTGTRTFIYYTLLFFLDPSESVLVILWSFIDSFTRETGQNRHYSFQGRRVLHERNTFCRLATLTICARHPKYVVFSIIVSCARRNKEPVAEAIQVFYGFRIDGLFRGQFYTKALSTTRNCTTDVQMP